MSVPRDIYPHECPQRGFYRELKWPGVFAGHNICSFWTIADGSCLLHGILNGYWLPYYTSKNRSLVMTDIRTRLAVELSKPAPGGKVIRYDLLSGGKMKEIGAGLVDPADSFGYTLEGMTKRLISSASLGNESIEHIGNIIDKDIYLLDSKTMDVYLITYYSGLEYIHKKRNSVVLLYVPGHYELMGLRDKDGVIATIFAHNDPFIRFIRARMVLLYALGSRR